MLPLTLLHKVSYHSDLPLPVAISTTHLGLSQLPHGFEPDLTPLQDSLVG